MSDSGLLYPEISLMLNLNWASKETLSETQRWCEGMIKINLGVSLGQILALPFTTSVNLDWLLKSSQLKFPQLSYRSTNDMKGKEANGSNICSYSSS